MLRALRQVRLPGVSSQMTTLFDEVATSVFFAGEARRSIDRTDETRDES